MTENWELFCFHTTENSIDTMRIKKYQQAIPGHKTHTTSVKARNCCPGMDVSIRIPILELH